MVRYILAIDLGTSGPKVALYATSGTFVGYEFEPTRYYLRQNGGAEQKPEEWWRAIKKATSRLLARDLVPKKKIAAICSTTQWSGTVAVDRDGNPLMDAIIWMDARGAPYIRNLVDGLVSVEGFGLYNLITWLRLTGGIPGLAGKDSIAHILYIKHQHPEVFQQTYKFLEPKDYLNLRLTGKYAASYDSITLHWVTDNRNPSHVRYHDGLLKRVALDREKLPDLKPAVDILGPIKADVADEWGLSGNVQVVMGTPDVMSAAIGSGAVLDYQTHLYIGTSSWIGCHVPFKKTDVLHGIASLPSAVPGRYLVSNEQETAGGCLNFLRDNVLYHQDELLAEAGGKDVFQVFDRIVEKIPAGSGGLIFTPWLYGERSPVDDRLLRGGLFNISLETTREHIIRAVFEGVAFNTRWLFRYVEKFIKRNIDPLHIVGGGAKSHVWCQIFADVLGRTVLQIEDPILSNARGAAFLGAVALGELAFEDIPDLVKTAQVFSPNPANRQIYDALFEEFLNLYQRNRKVYARLNHN